MYKRQPLNEFRYNPDLKVGDTVEVYIENQEDKKGQLVLSHRKARATRSYSSLWMQRVSLQVGKLNTIWQILIQAKIRNQA